MGLGGVTVRLSGMADAQTATDNNGQYAFTGLRAGTYAVEISGFDMDEVGFGSTSSSATVAVGESKIITFDGTYLRTAGIMGQVSVEGVGLPNVTVTMTGEGEDETDVTDAGGLYAFSKLKAGSYSVAISGYDPDEVEFTSTSMNVTVALGETANIPFEGTLLRTSGISGRVSVAGMGIPNVTVTLAGAAESTYTTMDDGQYSFAGLAEGTYVVSMENPDANAYNFETVSHTVPLGDSESAIRNFDGTHTRTASISGVLFIDEVMQDKMHTAGEPTIVEALAPLVAHGLLDQAMVAGLLANAKVIVRGPSLSDPPMEIAINADGTFTTGETLVAGSYQVELPANNDMVAAALMAAGVEFVGESDVVMVDAGGEETFNFPFRITMQTIGVGAVMGSADELSDPLAPVGGVTLALFPTAQDAEAGTNELGKLPVPTMTGETGMTAFQFARADDTSPGSEDTDNIVFVKVVDAGHEDLRVSDGKVIEVQYPGVSRVHAAPTSVRFLNVGVYFDFWVKSTDAVSAERGGDMGFGHWHTEVFMGDPDAEDAEALMKPDPDDEMEMVNATERTDTAMATRGKGTFSHMLEAGDLAEGAVTFTVRATPVAEDGKSVQPDGGEMWEQSDALTYEHDGLKHPALNTAAMNDRGPIRITYTTQTLTVAVYRETDDEPGFTDYQSKVPGGDQRPSEDVAEELEVEVMVRGNRSRLETYDEWDHDGDADTDPIDARQAFAKTGMVSFGYLPADMEFTVRFHAGSDRVAVGGIDGRNVETFGEDLNDGMSMGGFGDDGGAMYEVQLCPLTTDMRPTSLGAGESDCATFAYQWNTGGVSGKVVRRSASVGDAAVNLDAITSNHSPDEKTKSSKAASTRGNYSFSRVQDGDYWLHTPKTADHAADSIRLAFYHDETMDDDPDDGLIGNPVMYSRNLDVTALRLGIKGYVANVGHEDNQVVRGDETVEGAELELWAYDKAHATTGKYLTKGSLLATAETGSDGFYEFTDIPEGTYVVIAKSGDDYEVLRDLEVNGDRARAAADVYVPVDETNNDLKLPSWNYRASSARNQTNTVTVPTSATTSETFTFQNFALLHMDGEFLGRVYEARRDAGEIAVELRRCETVSGDIRCREETDFDAQTENTSSRGTWTFDGLREGFYAVNVAATNYRQAKWRGNNIIDDDAVACDGGTVADADCDALRNHEVVDSLVGKRAFNRMRANFYVYNSSLGDDPELSELLIEGEKDAEDGDEELEEFTITVHDDGIANDLGAVADPITYASESITLTPTLADDNASVRVIVGSLTSPDDTGRGDDGDEIEVDLEMGENTVTVIVTAENGYHDRMYSFNVTRTVPVDNTLVGLGLRTTRDAETGTAIPINPAFEAGSTEYTATVPTGTATGTTMSVYVVATVRLLQQAITVTYSDGGTMTELEAEGQRNNDGTRQKVYKVTVPKTGALNDKSVLVKVASEDGKELTYDIQLQRGEGDPTNAAPSFTSSASFRAPENQTAVGTVAATDSDTEDQVTGYTISGGADQASFDLNATSGVLEFKAAPDYETPGSAALTNVYTVVVTATSGTGARVMNADQTITVTVTDDPSDNDPTTPTVTMSLAPTSISEKDGTSTLTATVSPASATAFDVTVSASPAGAVTMSTTTLSFAANATSATAGVTITAVDNDVDAADQMVTISGTTTATGVTAPADVMLTITDDDGATPTGQQVTLVLDRNSITEAGGVSTVTARVSPASPTAFTVDVSAAAVSPAVGGDFTLSTDITLSFAANATRSTGTVTIEANDNTADAPDKSVMVSGSVETTGATAESPAEVTLTITDDDDVPGLPLAFNVEAGDQNAVLTWQRPRSIGTSEIEGYDWRHLPAGQTFRDTDTWNNVTVLTATVPSLDNGEAYQFQVRAKNGVTKDGDDGGPAVTGTGTPWPVVTLVLDPQTVTEKGATNESDVTATVANAASKPFTVTVSAEAVSPAVAGDFALAGSTLSFAADAEASTGDVKITAVDNDVDAANATVTVSGTMSTGSDAPDDVSLTITDDDEVPGVPGSLTATDGDTEVTLVWTFPSTEGTSDVTGFEYRYSDETLTDTDAWLDVSGGPNIARLVVTGLTNGTSYNFEVRAVSAAGNSEAATTTGTPTA